MPDYYIETTTDSRGEFKDRGSKFIAFAFPMHDESDFQVQLEKIKKQHPKSRHFCFAYRLGEMGEKFRSSDDGEPSGTAGKPILGQLIKSDLVNTGIIVIRYFGGTKLGVSGLINAYRESAAQALTQIQTKRKLIGDLYEFTTNYSLSATFIDEANKLGFELINQHFDAQVKYQFMVPRAESEALIKTLLKTLTRLDHDTIEKYASLIEVNQL